MNYWKLSTILTIFLLLGLTGAVSAVELSVSGSILPAAPVIDFTGTPTSGASPLTVTFTATNTGGAVTTWAWTFGDGGTSAEQNPSHQYTTAGTYTVTLTATNAGGSDTETKTDYITVNPNINLNIGGIVNCVPASAIFAKEPNTITVATIRNQGTDPANNVVVKIYASDVGGGTTAIAETTLATIAGGGSVATTTLTDPTIRTAEGTVTYTAKLDPDNLITETNEADNDKSSVAKPVRFNGYKGKRYWLPGSEDIITRKTYDLNGDIVYYTQPESAYKGIGWTTRTETWTAANLPIPAGATVEKAWLFFSYNWDQTPGGYPNLVTTFNGNTISLGTPYRDWSNFGSYPDYEYGLYPAVDVTSYFVKNGDNTLVTNPGNGGTDNQLALYPSTLAVIYSDASKTRKQIFINEECDDLAFSQSSYGTTMEEATAYAPFSGMTIDTGSVQSATLHSFAGSAGPGEGNLLFNGATVATNAWQGTASTASALVFNVKPYLTATGNEAGIQATQSGGMLAIQQILVVEYTAAAPVADFTATPISGDRPLTVQFTDTSSGAITSYAWNFGDGSTSTDKNPSHEYTARSTYTVSLTVNGPGGSDDEVKTNYITVKEPAPVIDFTYTPASGPAPLLVDFDATNTGGSVTSWKWERSSDGGSTWAEFATIEDPQDVSFGEGTWSVRVTATGPDYSAVKQKDNIISVGAATISVTINPATIDFGTMVANVDETGSSTVSVDVTGGTGWAVTASANNGGYMKAGALQLADAFQLSNGGGYQYMTSDFANFLAGGAGEDKNGPANVKQAIGAGDQPGDYSITLTFQGAFA